MYTTLRFYGPYRRRRSTGQGYDRNYYVTIYDPQTKHRRKVTTGQPTLKLACAVVEKWRIEAALHPSLRAATPRRLLDAWDAWIADLRTTAAEATLKTLASCRARLEESFAATYTHEWTAEAIGDWIRKRAAATSPATANRDRALLAWFGRWLVAAKLWTENAAKGVPKYRLPGKRIRTLPLEHEAWLLDASPLWLAALVVVAIETGLRRRALLGLVWGHVELDTGQAFVPASLMKSRMDLEIPLSKRACSYLRAYRAAGCRFTGKIWPQSDATVSRAFRAAQIKAGIQHPVTLHDLRRTFLTRARQRGVPMEVAMRISDHRDLGTVLKCYRQIPEEEMRAAVERGSSPSPRIFPDSIT